MSDNYTPPFTTTEAITNLVIEIAELTGQISLSESLSRNPKLRRENRIRSIHSSLAIEQNSLTMDQVSDIIDGKRVLGPPQDIREVKNAYEAYELLSQLNPYSIKDLLKAHKVMMADLVKESGTFRSKGVGVYAGTELIHAGTPPQYVPDLVRQLFTWLKESKLHPLVKSCVFHSALKGKFHYSLPGYLKFPDFEFSVKNGKLSTFIAPISTISCFLRINFSFPSWQTSLPLLYLF